MPHENPRSTAACGASGLLPPIEVLPLARRSLTVTRAFFCLSAVLTFVSWQAVFIDLAPKMGDAVWR